MKVNKLTLVAIAFCSFFACKNKDTSSTSTGSTVNTSTTASSSNASSSEVVTSTSTEAEETAKILEKTSDPKVIEAVKAIQSKELTPIQVLREMDKIVSAIGVSSLKNGFCSADREFMDSSLYYLNRLGKALNIDLSDKLNESMKSSNFSEKEFEFKDEKITGSDATVTIVNRKTKLSEKVNFVKESNAWKICANVREQSKKNGFDPLKMMELQVNMMEKATPEMKEQMKKKMQEGIDNAKKRKGEPATEPSTIAPAANN